MRGSAGDADLTPLRHGALLWKLRRGHSNRWYHRRYWLNDSQLRLCYTPNYKPSCFNSEPYIDLMDVVDVRHGWKTVVFNEAGRHAADRPTELRLRDEKCCFSIVCSGKSLDLVAPDHKTAATWVRGLNTLLHLVTSMKHCKNDFQ